MKRVVILIALYLMSLFASAQQQPQTIDWLSRATLPVVVFDKSGAPVHGLTPDAFLIGKGVKGAKVGGVREIEPAQVNGKRPLTILFDGIANPAEVQKSTRDAILAYLAVAARESDPVNLLITTQSGPRLVHSASTSPEVTLAALEKVDKVTHALGGRFASGVSAEEQAKKAQAIEAETTRLRDFEQKVETATFYRGLSVQFETLQMVANGLANVNGRKAVLWISSYFPVRVDEGKKLLALNSVVATDANEWWVMTTEYEKAVRMLNAAHVSVYTAQPVRGLLSFSGSGNISSGANTFISNNDITFVGLSQLSTRTGGTLLPFTTDMNKMAEAVQHDAGSYYAIDYELPAPPDRIDWKELAIRVAKDNVSVRRIDSLFLINTRHQNH